MLAPTSLCCRAGPLSGSRTGRSRAVTTAVRAALTEVSGSPPLVAELERLMARPRWSLAPSGPVTWPRYVLCACRVFGGDAALAIWPAAAVELVIAAIDIADDLIDGDLAELSPLERARLTNAVAALAFASQGCMARATASCLPPANSHLIARLVAACAYGSTAGQDLDLVLQARAFVSKEEALEATVRKSGSLGAMACAVGAAVATTDEHTLDLVQTFGRHLGTSAQLLNDMDGVDLGSTKSDLRERKKTLPVAYLLAEAKRRNSDSDFPPVVSAWYSEDRAAANLDGEPALQRILHDTGALQFAWIIADAHYREAVEALEKLAVYTGRSEVRELRRLLTRVKARRAR